MKPPTLYTHSSSVHHAEISWLPLPLHSTAPEARNKIQVPRAGGRAGGGAGGASEYAATSPPRVILQKILITWTGQPIKSPRRPRPIPKRNVLVFAFKLQPHLGLPVLLSFIAPPRIKLVEVLLHIERGQVPLVGLPALRSFTPPPHRAGQVPSVKTSWAVLQASRQ